MNETSNKIVGCDAVNQHINQPMPHTLWHYTSYAGFQGIITSKNIWATEYRFLNDREEFLHAKELAQALVEEEPEYVGERFPARDEIQKGIDIAFNSGSLDAEMLRIMVASFSEEGDQLSQWRGYGNNSRGVSIGIDLRNVRPPLEIGTAATFAPCIYEEAKKTLLLKAIFAHFRNGLQSWWDAIMNVARTRHLTGERPDPEFGQRLMTERSVELHKVVALGLATLQFDLLRTAPLLKNQSFSEEKEWRLVLPWNLIKMPSKHPIEFRPTRDGLVPYVAISLNSRNQDGPIFCKDVILGPGSHPSAAVGVNMFLQKQEIPLSARLSKIPYRPA